MIPKKDHYKGQETKGNNSKQHINENPKINYKIRMFFSISIGLQNTNNCENQNYN